MMSRRRFPNSPRLAVLVVASICAAWQPASAQNAPRQLVFWKAASPTTTVYLLGSIHVGDRSMYPLPAAVESAFASSKLLVVEVNPKKVEPAQMLEIVAKYGMLPAGDTLTTHISKEASEALDAFCATNGLPRAALERFKPWFVTMTLTARAAQQAGADLGLGIDMHFIDQVKEPQRIEELETADFQMALLSSATDAEGAEMLASSLKQLGTAKELLGKLQAAYLSGDVELLARLAKQENDMPDAMAKKFVDDRNVTMAERIASYLKGTEACFVVVGALHVIGDKGIVRLLQDRGYKVERVMPDGK
jgi:uncharacterized protein YbaP (TraB family)